MGQWATRFAKARALATGRLRALRVATLAGGSILIPLAGHRRFWPGPMPDADLVAFLASRLADDAVFLDVGANIGVYSAALARAKGGRLRGAAFEPVPATHAILGETLRLNRLDGFTAERIALSSRPAELLLSAREGGANNFTVGEGDAATVPTVKVPCARLDDWVAEHPSLAPDAMKVDVEGHELAVLEGAAAVLRRRRPALVIECHCASWPALGVSAARFVDVLGGVGYSRVTDRAGAPVDLLTARETVQVLCSA